MVTVVFTTALRRYTGSARSCEVQGGCVLEALENVADKYPDVGRKLFREDGTLGSQVIIYADGRDIRLTEGVETPLAGGSELKLVAAIAGG